MADPLDVAGVAGTWVAAILAIIALVGIIGPFLVLQQTRSERYQALASVDSRDYVSSGFTPLRGYSFFRKGRVPVLDLPPRPDHQSSSAFFAISGTRALGQLKHGKDLDLESAPVTQAMSRSTGWVNFASTMELYNSQLRREDKLVVYGGQTWLPVHRFWLLAFGLRGRYGDRRDKGKASSSGNATRLRIEGHTAEDRDAAYDSTPLRGRLYGFTGTLWWKVSGQRSPGPDEAYFAMHPVGDRLQSLLPDPMPLPTLFWLSLGCLPLPRDPEGRVFDLAGFLSANQRVHRDVWRREGNRFFRFEKRRDFKGYHSIHNTDSTPIAANGISQSYEDDPTNDPGDASSKQWADAMGIDLSQIWCMNRCRQRVNIEEELFKGLWWARPDPEDKYYRDIWRSDDQLQEIKYHQYIWRSDIQLQALAILHIPMSPTGFLFDQERIRLKPTAVGAECTVFNGSSDKLISLMSRMDSTQFCAQLSKQDRRAVERLWSCFPYRKIHEGSSLNFGRYRTNLSYELDTKVLSNRSALPAVVQDVVGILTVTSHLRSTPTERRGSNTPGDPTAKALKSLNSDGFLDLLIDCMADSSKVQSFYLEVDVGANVVRVSSDGNSVLQASVVFDEVFVGTPSSSMLISGRHQNFAEVALSALRALLRGVVFETAIDSNKLLNIVEKMTDVVNMSAATRPPPLEATGGGDEAARPESVHTGYTSLLAASEVDSYNPSVQAEEIVKPRSDYESDGGEGRARRRRDVDLLSGSSPDTGLARLARLLQDLQETLVDTGLKVGQVGSDFERNAAEVRAKSNIPTGAELNE